MKRTKWNPRKVLVASAGVASVNYAVATGCMETVANLVVCPPSQCPPVAGNGGASVANLVAPPPGGTPNLPDASTPDAAPDDAGARDAAPDGAA